jgi:hypothetical protein
MEDFTERLMQQKAWLADIFPETVPEKPDGRYFGVERLFRRTMPELSRRFGSILLKLYCWYDMTAVTEEEELKVTSAESLAALIGECFRTETGYLLLVLPECDTLISLSADDLYMTVYSEDGRCLGLLGKLAQAEGLFFYAAP